jgi:enoyl-CoA hydratase/carnithine racemase
MRLVDRVSATGGVAAEVAAYAQELAGNSLASIKVAKTFIARAEAGQVAEDAATLAAYLDILEQPDFQEGRRAFAGKVKPEFS